MLFEGFLTGAWGQNPWNSAGSWIKISGISAFGLVLCPSDRFYGEFFIFYFFPSSIGNPPRSSASWRCKKSGNGGKRREKRGETLQFCNPLEFGFPAAILGV